MLVARVTYVEVGVERGGMVTKVGTVVVTWVGRVLVTGVGTAVVTGVGTVVVIEVGAVVVTGVGTVVVTGVGTVVVTGVGTVVFTGVGPVVMVGKLEEAKAVIEVVSITEDEGERVMAVKWNLKVHVCSLMYLKFNRKGFL